MLVSFNKIVQFAIEREEEAAQGYRKMLKLAKDEGVKKLLLDLEQEEKQHKKILQGLTEARVKRTEAKEVTDLKISDYLLEEPLGPEMTFQDLLIFAAKKEKKAVELYVDLAKKAKTKEEKRLFDFLTKQEKSHKLRLEIEYDKHVLWED